jgi:hypothetical protein
MRERTKANDYHHLDRPDSRTILESFLIHFDEENLSFREVLLQRAREPSVPAETLDNLVSSLRTLGFDASGYVPTLHCKRCHETYQVNGPQECVVEHEWREEPVRGGPSGYIWECDSCGAESEGYDDGPSDDIRHGGQYCFEGYHTQNSHAAPSDFVKCRDMGCQGQVDDDDDEKDKGDGETVE